MPSILALPLILNLLALAVFLGLLSYSRRREYAPAPAPGRWLPAAGAVLLGFLLTVPTAAPFAPGMRLGLGYLFGGVLALLAVYALARLDAAAEDEQSYVPAALIALPALALAIIMVLAYGNPDDLLIGLALGTVVVAILSPTRGVDRHVDWLALVTVTLCAAQFLAVHRFGGVDPVNRVLPLLLAGLLSTILALPALLRTAGAYLHVVVLIGLSLLAWLYLRFLGHGRNEVLVLAPLVLGLAVGWIATWLIRNLGPRAPLTAPVIAFAMLLHLALSYKLLAGYGMSLGLLGLLVSAGWVFATRGRTAADGDVWSLLRGAAWLVLGVVVFRLFLERHEPARGVELEQQFALLGLLLGLAVPLVLGSAEGPDIIRPVVGTAPHGGPAGSREDADVLRPLHRSVALAIAALTPALCYVIWDYKALVGLLLGLVAYLFLAMYRAAEPVAEAAPPDRHPATAWLAVLMGLVAVQFAPLLEPLTNLPRAHKAIVILLLAGVAIAVIAYEMVRSVKSERGPADVA